MKKGEGFHKKQDLAGEPSAGTIYEIRIKGHLSEQWSRWFDGLTITNFENGEGLLSGAVMDQAALHGILERIRDLNLTLVSVNPVTRKE